MTSQLRIPAIYNVSEYVHAGGLMSYGENLRAAYRHAAVYIDQLARGARPNDLPVGQPTRFEFVVNLTTARSLGLVIPQSTLLRADAVIG